MGQNSENKGDESSLDLDDVKLMEESVLLGLFAEDPEDMNIELEQEQQGELVAKLTITRLRIELEKRVLEAEEEITDEYESNAIEEDFVEDKIEIKTIQSVAHLFLEYFTLISIFVESYSTKILEKEIITEKYSGTKKTKNLLEHRIDQETREDFLLRMGIIDESLKSEMSHIRSVRNGLVHNFSNHLFLEGIDSVISEADRAYDVYTQLLNMVSDEDLITLEVSENLNN